MCTKKCSKTGCPFAHTEKSELIQNYGCLPTQTEILNMRVNHGKTWACHSEPTEPCLGGLKTLKRLGYECDVKYPLVTENDDWTYPVKTEFLQDLKQRQQNGNF